MEINKVNTTKKNNEHVKKLYIIFSIFLIIIAICLPIKKIQNDTFFAIATGNSIINNGYDNLDHLTWHENLSFYKLRWLFDVMIAQIYNMFGFMGIHIFVIIMNIIIALSLFNILLKQNNNLILSFCMTIFSTYFMCKNWLITARGQIMSCLFLIWEIYYLEKLIKTNKKRYYLYLFLTSVLIVNFHASVWQMMIIILLPYLAEAILYKILYKNKEKNNKINKLVLIENIKIKPLIYAIIIIILGSFLSPIGGYTYSYMFKVLGGLSTEFIMELQPTNIFNNVGILLMLIMFLTFIYLRIKIKLSDLLLFSGLFFMAILAKRNQIFMYSIGIISLTRIFNNFFIYFRFNEYFDLLFKKTINYKYICLIGILIIISLADNIIINFKIDYISPKKYPVKATEFIKQNLDYKNLRIYNSFNYGSYLEFNNILAFIDSRSEIYCKEFNDTTILEDWLSVNNNIKHYSEIFTKYGIDYILINKKESIFIYIDKDENFEKIYNDEFFYIYKCKDKTI